MTDKNRKFVFCLSYCLHTNQVAQKHGADIQFLYRKRPRGISPPPPPLPGWVDVASPSMGLSYTCSENAKYLCLWTLLGIQV